MDIAWSALYRTLGYVGMSHTHDDTVADESNPPAAPLRELDTAEYPAVDGDRASYIRQSVPTGEYAQATTPAFAYVDVDALVALPGFVSLRIMYMPTGKIVQEAKGPDVYLDLDWHTVGTLRDLGRSEDFESLGMVSRGVLTVMHALSSYNGFACILVIEQSRGNLALAKMQIQRAFSTQPT